MTTTLSASKRSVPSKPGFQVQTDDKDIFKDLRFSVKKLVDELAPQRRSTIVLKAFLFPAAYIAIYAAALIWGSNTSVLYSMYFLMGLFLVFIFLNLIHDAVHETIFKQKWANKLFVYFFDLMGANSYIWQLRHVRFHHNYPNVDGWDTDIEQSPLFKLFPSGAYSRFHKYQHIYLPLIYPFYLLNWMLVRDFKDFFNKKKPIHKLIQLPKAEYVKLFVFKAIFIFYILVLPKILLDISWGQMIAAFLIMMFTASIFSLGVLLSLHPNTENEFPLPDENNMLPHSWMMHMMLTTNDVTHDNFFTRFFMGCFNYHVVHHMFPNVNHIYYPEVTELLKQAAVKHQLPYKQQSLLVALKGHYELIKANREPVGHIFEETM